MKSSPRPPIPSTRRNQGVLEVSATFYGDPAVLMARYGKGGARAVWLWTESLMWRSAHRDEFDSKAQAVPPLAFIPDAVVRKLAGRGRNQVPGLIEAGLWERAIWRGSEGYHIKGEGRLWRIRRQSKNSPPRRAIPASLRTAVYDRDGNACLECGTTERLSLDHIYPYSKGGADTIDNLQTLCIRCNSRKGARV